MFVDADGRPILGIRVARKVNVLDALGLGAVYALDDPRRPKFVQLLPTGSGPEGIAIIAKRGLLAVAAERGGSIRLFGHNGDVTN